MSTRTPSRIVSAAPAVTSAPADNLLVKYRPERLSDVYGQAEAVRALRLFLSAPYSGAFLFSGDTGIGKTATARALACELGVAVEEEEFGGFHEIPSGEMKADEVRRTLNALAFRPMFGSGWKVLIANEADRMTTSAETIWLDGLEHLPERTVVVFTTNEPERLTKRFRDRCECIPFTSETKRLRPALRAFCRSIWDAEVGKGTCPMIDRLGLPTLDGPDALHASFRLAVQQLQRLIRETKQGGTVAFTD